MFNIGSDMLFDDYRLNRQFMAFMNNSKSIE
jgi:hypothetical protein